MPRKKKTDTEELDPLSLAEDHALQDTDAPDYISNTYTVHLEPVYYRCTKGHQWSSDKGIQRAFSLDAGGAGRIDDLCPHCLYLFLNKLLAGVGRVGEVRDDA